MSDVPDGTGLIYRLLTAAEWSAREGVDVNLAGFALAAAGAGTALISYTPAAGTTFIVCQIGISLIGLTGTVAVYFHESPVIVYLAVMGGNQGGFASLNKPIEVAAGQNVKLTAYHFAAGPATLGGHIGGYLV